MSWKILKWQFVIRNCILSSRGIWDQTTSWRPGKCPHTQAWVYHRIIVVICSQSNLNMQVTDFWNHFDSTGPRFPLNALSNLDRPRPKRLSVILSMKKVNGLDNIAELNNIQLLFSSSHRQWILWFFYKSQISHVTHADPVTTRRRLVAQSHGVGQPENDKCSSSWTSASVAADIRVQLCPTTRRIWPSGIVQVTERRFSTMAIFFFVSDTRLRCFYLRFFYAPSF